MATSAGIKGLSKGRPTTYDSLGTTNMQNGAADTTIYIVVVVIFHTAETVQTLIVVWTERGLSNDFHRSEHRTG